MKKLIVLFLIVSIVSAGFLFAGGQKDTGAAPASEPAKAAPAAAKVMSMATDVGGLGDKSFNDGAYEGLLMGRGRSSRRCCLNRRSWAAV